MASSSLSGHFLALALLGLLANAARAQLTPQFYAGTCPSLEHIVRSNMILALSKEARMGASILRLFFHDCFVLVRLGRDFLCIQAHQATLKFKWEKQTSEIQCRECVAYVRTRNKIKFWNLSFLLSFRVAMPLFFWTTPRALLVRRPRSLIGTPFAASKSSTQ